MMEISLKTYLMGRDIEYPVTEEVSVNIARLLFRVNNLLKDLPPDICPKESAPITSGYRPGRWNVQAGGAARSAHLTGEAVDLSDAADKIDSYITAHPELLEKHNLWREDASRTKGWVHLQTRQTTKRTFNV